MNDQNVLDSYDGEDDNAGTQIEQHRNPFLYDPKATAYDTTIIPMGIQNGRACYSFSQSVLELFNTLEVKESDTLPGLGHKAGENVVFLYYIQTPQRIARWSSWVFRLVLLPPHHCLSTAPPCH